MKKQKRKETISGRKQPLSIQKSMDQKKIEVIVIRTEEQKLLLLIGNETIEISDYKAISSSDGTTELCITIRGESVSTELLAISKK